MKLATSLSVEEVGFNDRIDKLEDDVKLLKAENSDLKS